MKHLPLVLAFFALCSAQSNANILFCDFDKTVASLGIRDLESFDSNQVMQESWFTHGDQGGMNLVLDQIHFYEVSDEAIQVAYTAHSSQSRASKAKVSLDLNLATVTIQVCTSPAFGVPARCAPKSVQRYVGKIDIKAGNQSINGKATCDWQFRDTP